MSQKHPMRFGGAVTLTVTLLLFALLSGHGIFLVVLAAGWLCIGFLWLGRRFGWIGVVPVIALAGTTVAAAAVLYWLDEPNRVSHLRIRQIKGCIIHGRGEILWGAIDKVLITSDADDAAVREFLDVPGIEQIRELTVYRVRLQPETVNRMSRLKSLRTLYLEETGLTGETLLELHKRMPECSFQLR